MHLAASFGFLRWRAALGLAAALVLTVALALGSAASAQAQQRPDSLAQPQPDVVVSPGDSAAATETASVLPFEEHHPDGALWRAAAVPGWGQFYNRQYYKMPVVYLGLGGVIAAIVYTQDRYRLYRNAYRFSQRESILDDDGNVIEAQRDRCADFDCDFEQYRDDWDRFSADVQGSPDNLRRNRENFRRNRDLSIIGVGIFYALTIVDAYVSAHLVGFDVGEDLSASVHPRARSTQLTLRYTF